MYSVKLELIFTMSHQIQRKNVWKECKLKGNDWQQMRKNKRLRTQKSLKTFLNRLDEMTTNQRTNRIQEQNEMNVNMAQKFVLS